MVKTKRVLPEDWEEFEPVDVTTENRKRIEIMVRAVDADTGLLLASQSCLFLSKSELIGSRFGKAVLSMVTGLVNHCAAKLYSYTLPSTKADTKHDRARANQLASLLQSGGASAMPSYVVPTDDPKKFLMITELVKE